MDNSDIAKLANFGDHQRSISPSVFRGTTVANVCEDCIVHNYRSSCSGIESKVCGFYGLD
jgi:hypothetical protein